MIYILYRLLSVPLRSRLPASYIHRMCVCVCVVGGSHDVLRFLFARQWFSKLRSPTSIGEGGRERERDR